MGIAETWETDGFVVLPGYLSAEELAPAQAELGKMFPSAEGFHDGSDPRRARFLDDEFNGIDGFPFASTELSLLAVHPKIVGLAETLLGEDLRIYSAESWAKYTGAADYDQDLHRDYLNHTIVVPSSTFRQVEMFVYLVDVPEALGPPHLVPATQLPATPNWFPRFGDSESDFVANGDNSALYDAEVSAAGPAGTVVAFGLDTFHRGTAMAQPGGARYTMHLNYRPAAAEWAQRHAWAERSHEPAWYRFVGRATPHQLALFGFPPPGHSFWTPEALAGTALRYPELDLSPWA
ncbi:phytanoyl-CoA dioxygenase family protein [Amycolatopsis sp.]|jgi:hypothetical protein|uniref:phytanoyl-CoA dioxygenase family protein n=1 Tax=Amycolatopsis sp. TaxID=37632 RepID=UPI002E07DCCA|nr:phytanoyl-CoA dioxygenase family protein [Amycolatopsis sp.]